MSGRFRRACAIVTLLVLAISIAPVVAGNTGQVEGIVVGPDGRPAEGFGVLLIDHGGQVADTSAAGEDGLYRFARVDAGEYGLAITSPEGQAAPVLAPPTRVRDGQLVRRDIRLVPSTESLSLAPGASGGGSGAWWAGLPAGAKVGIAIGGLVVLAVLIDAVTTDEQPVSGWDYDR